MAGSPASYRMPTVSERVGGTPLGVAGQGIGQVFDRGIQREAQSNKYQQEEEKYNQLQALLKNKKKAKEAIIKALSETPEGQKLMSMSPLKDIGVEGLSGLEVDKIVGLTAKAKELELKSETESKKLASKEKSDAEKMTLEKEKLSVDKQYKETMGAAATEKANKYQGGGYESPDKRAKREADEAKEAKRQEEKKYNEIKKDYKDVTSRLQKIEKEMFDERNSRKYIERLEEEKNELIRMQELMMQEKLTFQEAKARIMEEQKTGTQSIRAPYSIQDSDSFPRPDVTGGSPESRVQSPATPQATPAASGWGTTKSGIKFRAK